jgi:hypothetical protein
MNIASSIFEQSLWLDRLKFRTFRFVQIQSSNLDADEISVLLRGELASISGWIKQWNARRFVFHLAIIILGSGCYGAAMGWWRDPQEALYVALKFPVIILLTTLGNALINAMLAPLLGLNMSVRESISTVIISFTVTSAILGAFSPIMMFAIWNAPAMVSGMAYSPAYNFLLLANVLVITLAGTTGNLRLYQLLQHFGQSREVALRVLFAWQASNLFLGSQLSWIMRPFIGSPNLPVEFLRPNALHGNFYEAVAHALQQILNH